MTAFAMNPSEWFRNIRTVNQTSATARKGPTEPRHRVSGAAFDSYAMEYAFDSVHNPSNLVTAVNFSEEDEVSDLNNAKTLQILQSVPLDDFKADSGEFSETVLELTEEERAVDECRKRVVYKFEKPACAVEKLTIALEKFAPTPEQVTAPPKQVKLAAATPNHLVLGLKLEVEAPKATAPPEPAKVEPKNPVYPCETCGKVFKMRHHLNRHKLYHTEDKPFVCKTCQKCFRARTDLTRHEKTHNNAKDALNTEYTCQKCSKAFNCLSNLTLHLKTHLDASGNPKQANHEDVMPYKCDLCSKCFSSQAKLNLHNKSHQENPHFCESCQKFFSSEENLRKHNLMHSVDRKYKCSTCTKGFNKPGDLAKHESTHRGDKYFFCRVCKKAYTQQYHRDRHEKNHQNSTKISHQTKS